MTKTYSVHDYDLAKTLKSGQVFRVKELNANHFEVRSIHKWCRVRQDGNVISLEVGTKDAQEYWEKYFSFDDDPHWETLKRLTAGNAFLEEVLGFSAGMRILRQDPWETLVSFILSQRCTIPHIKDNIEKLCESCGSFVGSGRYAFPTPDQINDRSLHTLGFGYRESYIYSAACAAVAGDLDPYSLKSPCCSYDQAMQALLRVLGVGYKVANCVCLFGLGFGNAFPVDAWMQKILEMPEMFGFNRGDYGDSLGLLQQCLFYYARENKIK